MDDKDLLDELRQAGQKPDQALLDRVKARGQAVVPPLIEMAVDENLHDAATDSPEVWAPLHAIWLLGEMEAPEAVEPFLRLLDQVDDEWLAEALPVAFGGIGAPAVAPLRDLLFDRTRDVWARVRAAGSLGKIGQGHPETRPEVLSVLVARLDPSESRVPEDEILTAFAVSALLDLKAAEAAPAIRRAFEEDRVDTSIVDLNHALEELGLRSRPRRREPRERTGMRLRLRCTACRYEREHEVGTVYCDLPTLERREKGEETPYSEFVIARPITCPKCGAIDQYEFTGSTYIALMAEMLKKRVAREHGQPGGEDDEGNLKFIRFGLTDGREIHPTAAREMYRQKVEAEPRNADLRVRYGNVLRFLGRREEASEQYRAALSLEESSLEAYLNLARYAAEAGNFAEARWMYESILKQAPGSGLPRGLRDTYVENAEAELAELRHPNRSAMLSRLTSLPVYEGKADGEDFEQPMRGEPPRVARKIGRNDPCPCGSGKKYKKCHGL